MKIIEASPFIAIALFLFAAPIRAMDLGPETRIETVAADPTGIATIRTRATCNKGDEVVFSCPLGDGHKTASTCAASDATSGQARFYDAYGQPDDVELTYPSAHRVTGDAFTRTHLALGGNAGVYAYAFVNNGYKYVMYAIAGERNQLDGGVIIQRTGERKVVAKLQCQPGRIIETEKDAVIDATLRWKHDSLIEAEGLPAMR